MQKLDLKNICRNTFTTNNKDYVFYDLQLLGQQTGIDVNKLPYSLNILLENLIRNYDTENPNNLAAFKEWFNGNNKDNEIFFNPSRILMQDFTGVPAVVDLAAMRTKLAERNIDPKLVNPVIPVDLVIDHSVQVDKFGTNSAMQFNTKLEIDRNKERYQLLKWSQNSFKNIRVVPPGTGICHQVNLEYFANVVWEKEINGELISFPDTLVGTDSHTTMINGLGVLGWGVGGIEAESAMLGQPIPLMLPDVVGVKLTGKLNQGTTATDLVLTITQQLRKHGVVGKFVEYFGPGIKNISLAERATISNMSPEYGATCGYFPIDQVTIDYLSFTGRSNELCSLVKAYTQAQGLWFDEAKTISYTDTIEIDLNTIIPSVAGPARPRDRMDINKLPKAFKEHEINFDKDKGLQSGSVVIAAITSCTNTSNPHVLLAAGLLAKKAVEKGLMTKEWVKTSLAPGSKVVTKYLEKTGLQKFLDQLGFNLVGYGCTTCIGNSGPIPENIDQEIVEKNLTVCSVLSGNRNFAGRISPHTKMSWLASPPLVIAYALAGTMNIDLTSEPIGKDPSGNEIFLKDIWPNNNEISEYSSQVTKQMFIEQYKDIFNGDKEWKNLQGGSSTTYDWDTNSTYIRKPPFLDHHEINDITNANILAIFGDTITTDHISPAGSIPEHSPTGDYLKEKGIKVPDFNSYGTRRGNHEVMVRASFSNIRIRNEMVPEKEGGFTIHYPSKKSMSIYDAIQKYKNEDTPLIIISGKEYGTGSSRDWAAKGTRMLGIKAIIAEGYERIHRSNLIGMGVLPLQFNEGDNRESLNLSGEEKISISGIKQLTEPKAILSATISYPDGKNISINLLSRIDSTKEIEYFRANGILNYVLEHLSQ